MAGRILRAAQAAELVMGTSVPQSLRYYATRSVDEPLGDSFLVRLQRTLRTRTKIEVGQPTVATACRRHGW